MKVEKIKLDEPDRLEIIQQVPDESQKLWSSITQFKGHTLFEIDCTSGVIVKAKYEQINSDFEKQNKVTKVVMNPNCLYISCLNKKSAMKKYLKWITGRITENNTNEKEAI